MLKLCSGAAAVLLILLSCFLLLFWMPATASAVLATGCPIDNFPPTPTAGDPFDPGSIKINELLPNPDKDWSCNGKIDSWIELVNLSDRDVSLSGLQICCDYQDQPILLPLADRIAAHSFLVVFASHTSGHIKMLPGGGKVELVDSQGINIIDEVNYPPIGPDQSYIRDSSGQWSISATPTPGAPNTSGSIPTPTPTPTKRSSGGGGGGGETPTATTTPIGSVFIPTDTPDLASQISGNDTTSGGNGESLPSWLKITLMAGMGAGLLAVVVWYVRSWRREPESDT